MISSLVKSIFLAGLALLISVPVASQQNLETIKINDLGPVFANSGRPLTYADGPKT